MAEYLDFADVYDDNSQRTLPTSSGTEDKREKAITSGTQESSNSGHLSLEINSIQNMDDNFCEQLLQLRGQLDVDIFESKETDSLDSLEAINRTAENYCQVFHKRQMFREFKERCESIDLSQCDRGRQHSWYLGEQREVIKTPEKLFFSDESRSPFGTPSPKRKWHGFTDADDEEVLRLLISKNLQSRITDKTIWDQVYKNLLPATQDAHTPSSVQNRFRRKIFPNLVKFVGKFEESDISKFPKRYQGMDSPHKN